MKTRISIAALLCSAMFVAYLQGQGGRQGGPPQPSKLDLQKVTDDLYVIHNAVVPGNTTALITNDGVVLVDDKFPQDHDNIIAMLKTVTNQPVKWVINTHHHGDHTGGNAAMQKIGATMVSSERARQHMVDDKMPGIPTVTFDDHSYLHVGGKDIELYYFGRAHTSGDTFVYFPAQRVLAAGDAFTYGDATPQLVDYAGGGSAKDWPMTLDAAMRLDFATVVPGHGDVTTKAEMQKFRAETMSVRTQVHDMLVQKKTKDEIWAMLQKDHKWAGFQQGSIDGLMAELR
jgi:glyoxylase-like metal-dependent hydrolase (beta-lactamase superfamily II)